MADLLTLAAALGLVTLTGGLLLSRLVPAPRVPGSSAALLGGGFILGVALAGLLMRVMSRLSLPLAAALTTGVLVSLALLLAAWSWRDPPPAQEPRRDRVPMLAWVLMGLMGLIVALNLWWMLGETLQRPLLGWDAWKVWAVKPQVWFAVAPDVRFVSVPAWLAAEDPLVYTVPGYQYPELLGRFQLWLFQLVGRWAPALGNLAWPFAWVALIATNFGLLRLAGVGWSGAALMSLLLACAPFPAVHGALAGYMDLWVAAQMLLATGLLVLWLQSRRVGLIAGAMACLLAVCMTKVEGVLWMGVVLLSTGIALLTRRQLWTGATGLLVVGLAWFSLGGFEIKLLGSPLVLRPELIEIPYLGRVELAFENRLGSFGEALFVYPNWHVLGALMAVGIPMVLVAAPASAERNFLLGMVLLGGGFLFVLFNFTTAGYWAEDLTASNRLTLHLLPSLLWLLAVVHQRAADEAATVA